MTPEQARQVTELLGKAKNNLMDAIAIVERSSSAKIACQIGTICGKTEVLQNKVSALTVPKTQTLNQFIRSQRRSF